jgi:hypothetical protein
VGVRRLAVLRSLGALAIVSLAAGCGGGTPTSPANTSPPTVQIPLGPQTLRVMAACAFTTPASVLPLLYARVTVSQAGAEWVANSGSDGGDVEIRFHQVGAALNGTMRVEGTIKGTAIHVPALAGSLPSWNGRATFGSGGGVAINGFAFNASALFPTAGLDGTGTGTIAFSDDAGGTCATSGFSWAIFQ